MKLKKYLGPDARTALLQIREELGPDAIIYSNRPVKNGVEIIASIEDDVQPVSKSKVAQGVKRAVQSSQSQPEPQTNTKKATPVYSEYLETPQESALKALETEFKSLKSLVQEQLSNLVWDKTQRLSPKQAMLLRNLLQRGFEPHVVKNIIQSVNDELNEFQLVEAVEQLIKDTLTIFEPHTEAEQELICFLGSPGAGKTMSLTKMATQLALKQGPDNLAIFTTDNHRIGAFEEISIYGKICHIPVYRIEDQDSLQAAIKASNQCTTIFIDTPGISPYNTTEINALAELLEIPRKIRYLLVLPANQQSECIEDTVKAFRRFPLSAAVITKLDEVKRYGVVLSAMMGTGLKVLSVSSGMNIPDDLVPFENSNLVSDALHLEQSRGEQLSNDSLARMISEVDINEI